MSNFFFSHHIFFSIKKVYPHLSIFLTSYLCLLLDWKSKIGISGKGLKSNLSEIILEDTGAPETVGDGDVSKDVMIDKEPDNDELDRQPDQDESPEHTETDSGIETITDAVSNVAVESSKEFVNELTEEITPVDVESELGNI